MCEYAVLVENLLHELTGRGRRQLERKGLRGVVGDDLDSGRSHDLLVLVAQMHLEYVADVHVHEYRGRGGRGGHRRLWRRAVRCHGNGGERVGRILVRQRRHDGRGGGRGHR